MYLMFTATFEFSFNNSIVLCKYVRSVGTTIHKKKK